MNDCPNYKRDGSADGKCTHPDGDGQCGIYPLIRANLMCEVLLGKTKKNNIQEVD